MINNDSDYESALARVEEIFDAEPGSKDEQELRTLCGWIADYEEKNYPIPEPTEEDIMKFWEDQNS